MKRGPPARHRKPAAGLPGSTAAPGRGHADPTQVGSLLSALAGGRELPALAGTGIRLCLHDRFTGAALAGEDYQVVDAAQFDRLAREHPAIMMPPETGSLQLAVTLWAAAVERALRPSRRLFQPAPPADADQACPLLIAYLRETEQELQRLASSALPGTVRGRVLAAIGPPGIIGYVADPEPGHLGGLEVPIRYQRSAEYAVTRGQPPLQAAEPGHAGVHDAPAPGQQASREIRQALDAPTS